MLLQAGIEITRTCWLLTLSNDHYFTYQQLFLRLAVFVIPLAIMLLSLAFYRKLKILFWFVFFTCFLSFAGTGYHNLLHPIITNPDNPFATKGTYTLVINSLSLVQLGITILVLLCAGIFGFAPNNDKSVKKIYTSISS
jgi:hypothetical protein